MCPLQEQYDLCPFPPPKLLGFTGTMSNLTPLRFISIFLLIRLVIDTPSGETIGSPTFIK